MRIKIIGDNNCARATRHLLRMAGFAVTEFLPAEAITHAPHFGYAITIDLAPAPHTPDSPRKHLGGNPASTPDCSTHGQPAQAEREASSARDGASSSSFANAAEGGHVSAYSAQADLYSVNNGISTKSTQAEACATTGHIHFDSVDSALEAAILRHVTQLAAAPVMVDRPGGVVHSERELRIVIPRTGDAKADEAAAVAVEFGVLRGLLDLTSPVSPAVPADKSAVVAGSSQRAGERKKWWTFCAAMFAASLLAFGASAQPGVRGQAQMGAIRPGALRADGQGQAGVPVLLRVTNRAYSRPVAAVSPDPAQGEFSTGQQTKITDGANTLVVDPCKGQTKLYASINQTANTQLAAGTSSKKIYVCSIHVVVAAATSVALVEGTGSVCATGTAGVSGFGGATAATGWNFAANGGIVLGNGDAAVGAEGTSGDNLCLYNSGSGQVSGGISYVVQ